jgi:hypothetical protein
MPVVPVAPIARPIRNAGADRAHLACAYEEGIPSPRLRGEGQGEGYGYPSVRSVSMGDIRTYLSVGPRDAASAIAMTVAVAAASM